MIYAKSDPKETLGEHTRKLIKNYDLLKEYYGKKLDYGCLWEILGIAVKYHDLGKSSSYFQNKIIKNINAKGKEYILQPKVIINEDVPHSYLSPAFLPINDLNYTKEQFEVLFQAIAYHHERNQNPDPIIIRKIVQEELVYQIKNIKEDLDIEIPEKLSFNYVSKIFTNKRIKSNSSNYKLYILVKGLLHRIDHAASADETIENNYDKNVSEYTLKYFKDKDYEIRELQEFTRSNMDKNIIMIASTGMGKTEAALLWIGDDKGFFTLPLRVSINALFDRVKDEIKFNYVGLLHSTSMDHLEETGDEKWEEIYDSSKTLSNKLIFSTIDQIFKFPFKYRGYEKLYATMAYSKVVIDEIQAYSPSIVAVLIKAIEMIHDIGGKFMIMTATLPKIYTDVLKDKGILDETETISNMFLTESIRHRIHIKESPILYDIDEIVKRGRNKKVLVIVNTIDRAIEVFREIKTKYSEVNILHSLFLQNHRSKLETSIKNFADTEGANGIWVTTQIVEASLDIDFDYLFTEISTLDSLFQRIGRCYRKRKYDLDEPNVYIYSQEVKGIGSIYDKDIVEKGKKMLMEFDNKELKECDKVKLVENLYSKENLEGTEFLKEFKSAMSFLDNLSEEYDMDSKDAQKILRDIDSITIMPRSVFDSKEVRHLIEEYRNQENKNKRKTARRRIIKYTVNIPTYRTRKTKKPIWCGVKGLDDVFIIDSKYEFDEENLNGRGLLIEECLDNIF